MQLNPKRKQQYLDGEVGLIYNQEPIDRLWMIDPNVYGNNKIYWRSDKTPESFKPVEWFFEEDVNVIFEAGKKYKVVGNRSNHGFRIGQIVECLDKVSMKFSSGNDYWWLNDEDVEPYTQMHPDTPTTDDYKEVIRQLLNVYVIDVNSRGELKTPLADIMQLIDKAKSMIN